MEPVRRFKHVVTEVGGAARMPLCSRQKRQQATLEVNDVSWINELYSR